MHDRHCRAAVAARILALGAALCASCLNTGEAPSPADETARAALADHAPSPLPAPPADVTNRFADDPRAAALGQRFFFDPAFAGPLIDSDHDLGSAGSLGHSGEPGRVACVSCHVPTAGFSDARSPRHQIPLGAQWGLRRARSLLDVGQARLLMWDGRRDALYNQIFTPLESSAEMNSARLFAAQEIYRRYRTEYEALFGPLPPLGDAAQFPALTAAQAGCHPVGTGGTLECHGKPGDHAEYDGMSAHNQDLVTRVVVNMGKAIAAYERRLTCGPGRFDRWVQGDAAALTPAERHGAALFVRSGCATCHAGPFFSDQRFHNVGLEPATVVLAFVDRDDRGAALGLAAAVDDPLNARGTFSDGYDDRLPRAVEPAMEGAFRTPSLRCVSGRPSFMHTGQYRTLQDAVAFFNRGGDHEHYPGTSEIRPLGLSDGDLADLVAFLGTLDGPGPDSALLAPP